MQYQTKDKHMWFLVVVMTMTSDITPLWVFSKTTFETRETCIEFAMENKDPLFAEAIKAHKYQIPPVLITCVPEKGMKDIMRDSLEHGTKNDTKAMGESL